MFLEKEFSQKSCSPGIAWNATRKQHSIMHCKRRLCPECGKYWSLKWRQALAEKAKVAEISGLPAPRLALTLTFACDPGYERVQAVLRYFWQSVRKDYPTVTYFGVVEYNQRHTQPHLHFVLADIDFVPYKKIKAWWVKAQTWAKLPRIAHIERIEEIRGNAAAYFTKYITKLTGGKDELPRREQWQGRYVRYSLKSKVRPGFFPTQVAALIACARWNYACSRADAFDRMMFYCRKPVQGFHDWSIGVSRETEYLDYLVNRPWDYFDDFQRSELWEPPQSQAPLPGFGPERLALDSYGNPVTISLTCQAARETYRKDGVYLWLAPKEDTARTGSNSSI